MDAYYNKKNKYSKFCKKKKNCQVVFETVTAVIFFSVKTYKYRIPEIINVQVQEKISLKKSKTNKTLEIL